MEDDFLTKLFISNSIVWLVGVISDTPVYYISYMNLHYYIRNWKWRYKNSKWLILLQYLKILQKILVTCWETKQMSIKI